MEDAKLHYQSPESNRNIYVPGALSSYQEKATEGTQEGVNLQSENEPNPISNNQTNEGVSESSKALYRPREQSPFNIKITNRTLNMTVAQFLKENNLSKVDLENLLNCGRDYLKFKTMSSSQYYKLICKFTDPKGNMLAISTYHRLKEHPYKEGRVWTVEGVFTRSEILLSSDDKEPSYLKYWCICEIEKNGRTSTKPLPWRRAFKEKKTILEGATSVETGHASGLRIESFTSHTLTSSFSSISLQKKENARITQI